MLLLFYNNNISIMSKKNWEDTQLFKALKEKESISDKKNFSNILGNSQVMPAIENILDWGATTPKDFTLHNSEHSFRVAERIWEIIPEETKCILSEYEICLLLMSAYLHDIGMSPEFERVKNHQLFLVTDNKKLLSEAEINEFQRWIDDNSNLGNFDIRKDSLNDILKSDEVLAYYIRSKHNDWSGEWIRKNLADKSFEIYHDWLDDLVLICMSHHRGLSHLKEAFFDPKPVGNSGAIAHLRYLAMCLRIADVLENDPGRTPDVIFNHRKISDKSLKYWIKDHCYTLTIKENRFTIYARPEKAFIHKAIEETADWIEAELKTCDELTRFRPLNVCAFKNIENYTWNIDAVLNREIEPKKDTYEYIQGGFRPNTAKILELLGGSQLYGDPIWAIRELLQNAFDAVKERIAYQVVSTSEQRNLDELANLLGDLNRVEISITEHEDGTWLHVTDTGVGMTKNIIEKYFLVSGESRRHELLELDRKCKEKKFAFSRTGHFGIGVLSYFMIANRMRIKTKRELNTGYNDEESIAYQFEINGTHDFGELKNIKSIAVGTEISLCLKPDIATKLKSEDYLIKFIQEITIKTPCCLNVKVGNKPGVQYRTGWIKSENEIKNIITQIFYLDILDNDSDDSKRILTTEKELQIIDQSNKMQLFCESIRNKVEFICGQGEIENVGKYRYFLPYFKLLKGHCFSLLDEDERDEIHLLKKIKYSNLWRPDFRVLNISLKGISINDEDDIDDEMFMLFSRISKTRDATNRIELFRNAYIEIDLENADYLDVSVSRKEINIREIFYDYYKHVSDDIRSKINQAASMFDNIYGVINFSFTHKAPTDMYFLYKKWSASDNTDITLLSKLLPSSVYEFKKYIFDPDNRNLKTIDNEYNILSDDIEFIIGNRWLKNSNILLSDKNKLIAAAKLDDAVIYPTFERYSRPLFCKFPSDWSNLILCWKYIPYYYSESTADYMQFGAPIIYNENFMSKKIAEFKVADSFWERKIEWDTMANETSDILAYSNLIKIFLIYNSEDSWKGINEKKNHEMVSLFKHLGIQYFYVIVSENFIEVGIDSWKQVDLP